MVTALDHAQIFDRDLVQTDGTRHVVCFIFFTGSTFQSINTAAVNITLRMQHLLSESSKHAVQIRKNMPRTHGAELSATSSQGSFSNQRIVQLHIEPRR
jgi:hypothetical protein